MLLQFQFKFNLNYYNKALSFTTTTTTAYVILVCSLFGLVVGFDGGDKHALLEFKSAITEDPLNLTSNWNPKDKDPCSWNGVKCEFGTKRVTYLGFSSNTTPTCSLLSTDNGGNFTLLFPCWDFTTGVMETPVNRLKGYLSPAIGNLTELRVLSLGFNGFYGELPLEIGKLRLLEVLDLGFNAFNGSIPSTLTNCTSLKVINLSGNQLNGSVPDFFASFWGLQIVAFSFNMLSGYIPANLGDNCASLEHLHLAGNSLSGSIPSNIGNCGELRSLLLSSNMLQDDIPLSLGKLAKLEALDLSRNFLSGNIPQELGNCSQLKLLVLKNNYGSMLLRNGPGLTIQPEEDGMEDFNFFDGELPDRVITLPNLRLLWAPNVNLEGNFPQNWDSLCSNLEMLNLAENYFDGQMPASLQNCKNLFFLDVSANNLTGSFPEELPVPCMAVFNISQNRLQGNFPRFTSGQCSKLSVNLSTSYMDLPGCYLSFLYTNAVLASSGSYYLPSNGLAVLHDFSNNFFSGPVPPFLVDSGSFTGKLFYGLWLNGNSFGGNMSAYSFNLCHSLYGLSFNIGDNMIVGEVPSDIGNSCKCMKSLSLAGNKIVGSIPHPFSEMKSLVNLNLSSNKLQGTVPSYIGQMKDLKFLTLSYNDFSSTIPLELAKLSYLEVLELSSNRLYGQIPTDFVKLQHLNVLKLDHNNLTGKIPSGFSNLTSLSEFNVSFNNLSGSIPPNSNLMQCDNVQGNPNLQSCPSDRTSSEWEQDHSGNVSSQEGYSPPGNSEGHGSNFSPIEIASITSASIIVSVLILLIILLLFMKKFSCSNMSGQGLGRKEVVTCNSIGVELTYENVVRATGCFNVQNCIGSGGFGATYKAEISPGVVVAVKRLSIGRFQGVQQFAAEIRTLGRVQHPSLVTLIGYHLSESEMFLIYNYLPVGWASLLLRQGRANEFFTAGLWDSGPHDDLIDMLHLAIMCTGESLSSRPIMRQVAQRLKRIQPLTP
ncbi:hypothetical protein ACFE04_018292 [Oxalis oulophora]